MSDADRERLERWRVDRAYRRLHTWYERHSSSDKERFTKVAYAIRMAESFEPYVIQEMMTLGGVDGTPIAVWGDPEKRWTLLTSRYFVSWYLGAAHRCNLDFMGRDTQLISTRGWKGDGFETPKFKAEFLWLKKPSVVLWSVPGPPMMALIGEVLKTPQRVPRIDFV